MKVLKNFLIAILGGMFVLALLIKRANAEILLTASNIVPVYGPIELGMASRVGNYAEELRRTSNGKLYFVINSRGGRIDEADEIVRVINSFDNSEVVVISAESAAAGIVQLVKKPTTISQNGHLLFHHLIRVFNYKVFTSAELAKESRAFKKDEAMYFNKVGKRIKYSYKNFVAKFRKYGNWQIQAKESKYLKAIDKIEKVSCSITTSTLTTIEQRGSVFVETPLCPIKENL